MYFKTEECFIVVLAHQESNTHNNNNNKTRLWVNILDELFKLQDNGQQEVFWKNYMSARNTLSPKK